MQLSTTLSYNLSSSGRIIAFSGSANIILNYICNGDEPFSNAEEAQSYIYDFDNEIWIYDPIIMIPQEISKLQCVAHLKVIDNNIYETLLSKLDEDETGWDRIFWDAASVLSRNSAMVARMASALGMSDEDVDTFFIEASKIEL